MNGLELGRLREEVQRLADPARAEGVSRFFKTAAGEYGEGDQFLGLRVPQLRRLVKFYRALPRADVLELLKSPWHEERLLALMILVEQYGRAKGEDERVEIHRCYLAHRSFINNWDLVDSSASQIVGAHLDASDLELLTALARSESVWERRIAMIATYHWIKQGVFDPALHVAGLLLEDRHDLIHKAVGWMLREVGKRDSEREKAFLRKHYRAMPRTMLRYAIERFPEAERQRYLRGDL